MNEVQDDTMEDHSDAFRAGASLRALCERHSHVWSTLAYVNAGELSSAITAMDDVHTLDMEGYDCILLIIPAEPLREEGNENRTSESIEVSSEQKPSKEHTQREEERDHSICALIDIFNELYSRVANKNTHAHSLCSYKRDDGLLIYI